MKWRFLNSTYLRTPKKRDLTYSLRTCLLGKEEISVSIFGKAGPTVKELRLTSSFLPKKLLTF